MKFLLDTNILSETIKKKPHPSVVNWLESLSNNDIFISVLSLGEIRKGIEKLPEGEKKQKILLWLNQDLSIWFQDRILPIDNKVANKWGFISAHTLAPAPSIDSLIAATALTYNLILATRNVKDFNFSNLEVFNPWEL